MAVAAYKGSLAGAKRCLLQWGVTFSQVIWLVSGSQGFTMVAYSPRLWLMAAGETSSTSIKN
eukprot:1152100-Pelagomonas_calceolata.AAC.6